MTKANFSERCAEADHVWEEFGQAKGQQPTVYACKNCLTYANRNDAAMRPIMCAEPGCSRTAEMYMKPEKSWVCEHHFVGVILL